MDMSPKHDITTPRDGPTSEIEAYIAVDVEASGPNPTTYSLLTIGACTVAEPERTFYVELQPTSDRHTQEAMAVNQLSLEALSSHGLPPADALARFETWLRSVVPTDVIPIFVAFNAPFDWMFVNDYFHRFLDRNPFGHKALDIKALYMGLTGVAWRATSHRQVSRRYRARSHLHHHALQDAIDEAALFRQILSEVTQKTEGGNR
jgi:DNA polymerase III epsilon subunit-like protein